MLQILKRLRPDAVLPDAPVNEKHDGISYKNVQARPMELISGFTNRKTWISIEDSIAAGIDARVS